MYQVETRILHRGNVLACDSTRHNERQRFSISHIDNREFPGVEGVVPPGPYGYLMFIPSVEKKRRERSGGGWC